MNVLCFQVYLTVKDFYYKGVPLSHLWFSQKIDSIFLLGQRTKHHGRLFSLKQDYLRLRWDFLQFSRFDFPQLGGQCLADLKKDDVILNIVDISSYFFLS